MDYAQLLREEAKSSHPQFHLFLLALSKEKLDDQYFFFEGDEDPVFYIGHISHFLGQREHHEFICGGRTEVLKAHELVARDGRAIERSHFFIDKDHNDIDAEVSDLPRSIFQTSVYSFENYIVCSQVVRRFWVERLYLRSTDERLTVYVGLFQSMHISFMKRMRLLMAVVLIGRGVGGNTQLKLNLNNVKLDKVLKLDDKKRGVCWQPNALQNFLASSNMTAAGVGPITARNLRKICRNYLSGHEAKTFVRGKFEIWFFIKFLMKMSRSLGDKNIACASGLPRSKLKDPITEDNCIAQLSPLASCPDELHKFLTMRLGKSKVSS